MTAKRCCLHPGREAVVDVGGKPYCKVCQDGQAAAAKKVSAHVEPKACFMWYTGAKGWQPIDGTGCAHWVSHQKSLSLGAESDQCLEGRTFRVRTLVFHLDIHVDKVTDVRVGDLWVNEAKSHMGLVSKIVSNPQTQQPVITIQHDSSAQGKVAENDFDSFFGGKGDFYRS
jgi:hypothetical protein